MGGGGVDPGLLHMTSTLLQGRQGMLYKHHHDDWAAAMPAS